MEYLTAVIITDSSAVVESWRGKYAARRFSDMQVVPAVSAVAGLGQAAERSEGELEGAGGAGGRILWH